MPSRRYRSRKSLGGRINRIRYSVSKTDNTSIPTTLGDNSVVANNLSKSVVSADSVASGAVDSTAYGSVPYIPSGETNQRVPAPLNEPLYWTKVVDGLVELHRSGIHGDGELEDTQHVTAETDGLHFDATTGETARIYLTGRLDLPKSRKVYATWKSDLPIDVTLVYWVNTPTYFVESAYRADGVTHIDISNTSHTLALGDSVRLFDTSNEFNGLYKVVDIETDYVKATSYQSNYTLTVADSAYVDSTSTLTLTFTGIDPTVTVVRADDLIVLQSLTGYEGFGGYYRIVTADDTTTANTLVVTLTVDSDADVNDFYNTYTVDIYTETGLDSVNQQNFSPFGKVSKDEYHYVQLEDRTVWGADGYTIPIREVSLTNNVARVVTEFAHYLQVGDSVKIAGVDALLTSPPATPVFDGTHTVTISNNAGHSFNFSFTASNVASQVGFPGAVAITDNQYNPQQYAVYAELAASANSIRTLSEAKVFEVVGEKSTQTYYYNVTTVALTNNIATLTLDKSAPTQGPIIVNLDDATLSTTFDGTYAIDSISGNTVSYARTATNVASQAATGVVSADLGVQHSELSPSGLVFYGADGSIESRLGSQGLDEITLSNASIEVTGIATFESVNTNFQNVTGNARVSGTATFDLPISVAGDISITPNTTGTANLIGSSDLLRYHTLTSNATGVYSQTQAVNYYSGDILNRFARGLVYSVSYPGLASDNTITLTANRYALAAGSFTLEADRNYLFVCSPGSLGINGSTNVALRYSFVASNNVAMANYAYDTQASPGFTDVRQSSRFGAGYVGPLVPLVFSYQTTSNSAAVTNGFSNTQILAYSEIFWMLRLEYAAALHTNAIIQDSGHKNSQLGVSIYDMGPAYANSIGVLSNAESWPSTGTFSSGGIAANVITVTETVIANSTSSAYFDNYGIGDGGTGDQYANQESIYQGNPGTLSGTKKSQVAFESVTAVIPNYATKLASQNLAVTKIEVYLKNRHSYSSGGLTTKIGCSTDTNARNSSAPPAPINTTPTSVSFTKGDGKYVELNAGMRNQFANGTARSILISLTSASSNTYDSTLSNYGYFDGDLQTLHPKLRITYTYTTTV